MTSTDANREQLLADLHYWNAYQLRPEKRMTTGEITSLCDDLSMRGWRRTGTLPYPDTHIAIGSEAVDEVLSEDTPQLVEVEKVVEVMHNYTCAYSLDDEGNGISLVDRLCPEGTLDITQGLKERELLVDDIRALTKAPRKFKYEDHRHKYTPSCRASYEFGLKQFNSKLLAAEAKLAAYREAVEKKLNLLSGLHSDDYATGLDLVRCKQLRSVLQDFDSIDAPLDHNVNKPREWEIGDSKS